MILVEKSGSSHGETTDGNLPLVSRFQGVWLDRFQLGCPSLNAFGSFRKNIPMKVPCENTYRLVSAHKKVKGHTQVVSTQDPTAHRLVTSY
jgi:hypothetical protein